MPISPTNEHDDPDRTLSDPELETKPGVGEKLEELARTIATLLAKIEKLEAEKNPDPF